MPRLLLDARKIMKQNIKIAGIGIISACGRGIESYDDALRQGWLSPAFVEIPSASDKLFPIYLVKPETIKDNSISRKIRRADRFGKMAVLAAWDAVQDSGIGNKSADRNPSIGIIVSTAFGPHTTTFRFLDDILDYGDASVSPTIFSHSVHNAAASYIASVLDIHGPTLTLTQFAFSFHQALILAQIWLNEGRCKYVLVGSVDECGAVMEYICSQKLQIAKDGMIKPFNFSASPVAVPGEGSVFFLMTREKSIKKYCSLTGVEIFGDDMETDRADICILDADGMSGDERSYGDSIKHGIYTAGYAPVFGSIMTGSSFHCAAAALMLKKQIRYACPVQDNPHGVNLCRVTANADIKKVYCIRNNCENNKGIIKLTQ